MLYLEKEKANHAKEVKKCGVFVRGHTTLFTNDMYMRFG